MTMCSKMFVEFSDRILETSLDMTLMKSSYFIIDFSFPSYLAWQCLYVKYMGIQNVLQGFDGLRKERRVICYINEIPASALPLP